MTFAPSPRRDAAPGASTRASLAGVRFKVADAPWEFEAIHQLNYATFVDEIPQHPPNHSGRLVDRFDAENTYLVAVRDGELLGMTTIRSTRPFSLDTKVPDLDAWLPPGRRLCELRLLSVRPSARSTLLLHALFGYVWRYCLAAGFDTSVISGTTRQLKLYRHLGFEPFGPLIGTPDAAFQPMYLTRERAETCAGRLLARGSDAGAR